MAAFQLTFSFAKHPMKVLTRDWVSSAINSKLAVERALTRGAVFRNPTYEPIRQTNFIAI
jgi:hypothetical protein